MLRVARMRPATAGARATFAPRATAKTSSIVSEFPSMTTAAVIAGSLEMGGGRCQMRARRRLLWTLLQSARPVRGAVVVELEVGLRLERDEEVEGEVAV